MPSQTAWYPVRGSGYDDKNMSRIYKESLGPERGFSGDGDQNLEGDVDEDEDESS